MPIPLILGACWIRGALCKEAHEDSMSYALKVSEGKSDGEAAALSFLTGFAVWPGYCVVRGAEAFIDDARTIKNTAVGLGMQAAAKVKQAA